MLPAYYANGNAEAVIDTLGAEGDTERLLLLFAIEQLFAANASAWGLDYWELDLGLESYVGKPDEQRRSRLLSKLRGVGTVTINLIKTVAEAYDGGNVDVTEETDLYQLTITFIDTRGVPPNIEDLREAIEEIIPAHLGVIYQYRYLIWDELEALDLTWDELDALYLTWDEFEIGGWL